MRNIRKATAKVEITPEEELRREKERTSARLRHFRGVAASVMGSALAVWEEIWESCRDMGIPDDILDGADEPAGWQPACGWPEFREKLHLLRHYMDYTKRLCDGSVEDESRAERDESEV